MIIQTINFKQNLVSKSTKFIDIKIEKTRSDQNNAAKTLKVLVNMKIKEVF